MAHAEISPSSASRWMACPGSVAACRGLPDQSSEAAEEGTTAHWVGEQCLVNNTQANGYIGQACPDTGMVVDDDMARFVQTYVNFCRDIAQGGEYEVEVKLDIAPITGECGAHGTSDFVACADNELVVADLKYGRGVEVTAQDNQQLLIYAAAAIHQFNLIWDFERVRIVIIQPRLSAISEASYTVEQVEAFAQQVFDAAHATSKADAPLVPGEKQCRFCRAKGQCGALQAEVLGMFDAIEPDTASNDQLAFGMSKVGLVEVWCKAIRARTESELLAGNTVKGWKLVEGKRGARKWANPVEAEATLKAMRIKHDQMYEYSLISPTTAEKLAKAEVIGKRQWPRLQTLITQSAGSPSVAPESDKRPALVTDVSSSFEDVSETSLV